MKDDDSVKSFPASEALYEELSILLPRYQTERELKLRQEIETNKILAHKHALDETEEQRDLYIRNKVFLLNLIKGLSEEDAVRFFGRKHWPMIQKLIHHNDIQQVHKE